MSKKLKFKTKYDVCKLDKVLRGQYFKTVNTYQLLKRDLWHHRTLCASYNQGDVVKLI